MSQAAASALGVDDVASDAHDNLTFASHAAFLQCCSNEKHVVRVHADEFGRIHDTVRRYASMREV